MKKEIPNIRLCWHAKGLTFQLFIICCCRRLLTTASFFGCRAKISKGETDDTIIWYDENETLNVRRCHGKYSKYSRRVTGDVSIQFSYTRFAENEIENSFNHHLHHDDEKFRIECNGRSILVISLWFDRFNRCSGRQTDVRRIIVISITGKKRVRWRFVFEKLYFAYLEFRKINRNGVMMCCCDLFPLSSELAIS